MFFERKKKDGLDPTKEEEKKPFQYQQQPGEEPTPGPDQVPTQLQGTGTPGVIPTPTQYVPPSQNIPQTQTQTPPQQPTIPFVPPQVTTCPKCNNVMTFSPDGSPFCIACGYTPEK